jgi:arsenate reductase (thioredoxin)
MSPEDRRKVLFLCGENSCRSQMAEGFLRSMAGEAFEAYSAGSIATSVNPLAVSVMEEAGVEISAQRSKHVSEFDGWEFDFVITVCAEGAPESCPVFAGAAARRIAWDIEDPAAATGSQSRVMDAFRSARDDLRARLFRFVEENH